MNENSTLREVMDILDKNDKLLKPVRGTIELNEDDGFNICIHTRKRKETKGVVSRVKKLFNAKEVVFIEWDEEIPACFHIQLKDKKNERKKKKAKTSS